MMTFTFPLVHGIMHMSVPHPMGRDDYGAMTDPLTEIDKEHQENASAH